MEQAQRSPVHRWVRALHRDIGFLVIGLTVIYCLSGIVLTFRETDFLKSEKQVEKSLEPGLNATELPGALRVKRLKVTGEDDQTISFANGSYNKITWLAAYTSKDLPPVLNAFNTLHKATNSSGKHWFTLLYACSLAFLALSSFWMYRPENRNFKRGVALASLGALVSVLLLMA